MNDPGVTVLIPIGPKYDKVWLQEAITSVLKQTFLPNEILLVDDGANILESDITYLFDLFPEYPLHFSGVNQRYDVWSWCYAEGGKEVWINRWKSPWNIGFTQAFNVGVGLAMYNLIVYLASDDTLMPNAIAEMVTCWQENKQKDAFYSCSYDINGETHTIPNNLGMVTKNLWRWLGGYPPAAFVGPDAAMHSILMVHAPGRRIWVKDGVPLYKVREHPDTETHKHTAMYVPEMTSIRDKLTTNFVPNTEVMLI